MRSRLYVLLFVLGNAVMQTTVACAQQPIVKADTANQPSNVTPINAEASNQQPTLSIGIYNLGSRYITIANQGNRTCYQGVSMPSGRYTLAVGETTGSLSTEKDYFVIEGWLKYGKTITLRQSGNNLLITNNSGSSQEYNHFQSSSKDQYSEVLTKCLNTTEPFFETQPGYNISDTSTPQPVQVTGNLLSPEQKAQLTQLPIPIIAPNFLPAGFRLVKATGETAKYANGDDDSGYTIAYQGENNTCISVTSSQSGPRGLQKIRQEQTEFGEVTVYTENARDNSIRNVVSFLRLKGNPILISGGTLPDSTTSNGWKQCSPVSIQTYIQVLKSLSVVK